MTEEYDWSWTYIQLLDLLKNKSIRLVMEFFQIIEFFGLFMLWWRLIGRERLSNRWAHYIRHLITDEKVLIRAIRVAEIYLIY